MIPIIDMHCDTISELFNKSLAGEKLSLRSNELSISLEGMKKAGYMCQNFAMFVFAKTWMEDDGLHRDDYYDRKKKLLRESYSSSVDYVLAMSDFYDNQMQINADIIRPALSGYEIKAYFDAGLMSALKTVEEGAVYQGKVENLERLYDHGVRMTTLTWNFENELAYPNLFNMTTGKVTPDTQRGLKQAGRDIVKACEELGIIVDLSHLNDAGILEVLDIMDKDVPVVASHSNARSITGHARNLTDEMMKKIADRGGTFGINFCADFINDRGDNMTLIDDMVKHIKYMINAAGEDAIGFGSDFDGIGNKVEIGGCEGMQQIADRLNMHGLSSETIEKIYFRNVLRIYTDVL